MSVWSKAPKILRANRPVSPRAAASCRISDGPTCRMSASDPRAAMISARATS